MKCQVDVQRAGQLAVLAERRAVTKSGPPKAVGMAPGAA